MHCRTMSYGGRGGGRFGGPRGNFGGPKPVEVGKEYDVQISEISRQGDGIARVQGFVIFVKGGKVGQKAKVRITNIGARFATAEIVSAGSSSSGGSSEGSSVQREQSSSGMAPQVEEKDKPELDDYKSEPSEEFKPDEKPSAGQ